MSGRNCDHDRRAVSLIVSVLLAVSVASCATGGKPCGSSDSAALLRGVRSSAGVALTSAQYRVGTRELAYGANELRCVQLTPSEANSMAAALRAPRLAALLANIAAADYARTYSDMPHIVLDAGSGAVFIPANLLVDTELRELLRPLDSLFREKFKSGYRLPLLPTAEESAAIRRLWVLSGAHP